MAVVDLISLEVVIETAVVFIVEIDVFMYLVVVASDRSAPLHKFVEQHEMTFDSVVKLVHDAAATHPRIGKFESSIPLV